VTRDPGPRTFGRWKVAATGRIFPAGTQVEVRLQDGRVLVASASFAQVFVTPHARAGDDARSLSIVSDQQSVTLLPLEGQDPEDVARELDPGQEGAPPPGSSPPPLSEDGRARGRPVLVGLGLGLVAGACLLAGDLVLSTSDDYELLLPAWLATSFGFGMAAGVLAPRLLGWAGLVAGLACAAIVIAAINAVTQPGNPYAQEWAGLFAVLIAGLSSAGATIGFAVVSVERRLRFPVWMQVLVPPALIVGAWGAVGMWQSWSVEHACRPPRHVDGLSGRLTYRSNHGTICVADLQRATAEQVYPMLGEPADPVREPTWMPDGHGILLVHSLDGGFGDDELATIGANGELERFAWVEGFRFDDPAWSPDGSQIAISATPEWGGSLYLVAGDGSAWEDQSDRTTSDEVWHPTWSPDGTAIAFIGTDFPHTALYVLELAPGGTPRRLAEAAFDASPTWSPDGRWIAFEDSDPDAIKSIYLIRPDGQELHQIISSDSDDSFHPAWSPDGRWLAFFRQERFGDTASIWVARADGSNAQPLLQDAAEGHQTLDRGPSLDWAAGRSEDDG